MLQSIKLGLGFAGLPTAVRARGVMELPGGAWGTTDPAWWKEELTPGLCVPSPGSVSLKSFDHVTPLP